MIPLGQFFATYGFRTTFFAVLLVGLFAGGAGSFLYMRAQSLMSDVMGHSAILGVVGAFALAASLGANGQSTLVISLGAAASAFVAVALTNWVVAHTPTKPDAAMAVALSLFYGGGLCAIHILNHSKLPGKAGIMSYLFGNAATVRAVDLYTVAVLGAVATLVVAALWKEIAVLVFDPVLARVGGFRPRLVDAVLTGVVTIAIVLGVKSVGMILVVAFALMPAAVVRPFVSSMLGMVAASAGVGALAGACGAYLSISMGNVPTGPIVVLVLFAGFLASLAVRALRNWRTGVGTEVAA
ncbi:manganese/zinc/iron transport system permease protein [Arcanobacterium wilhelmae]|uniref:Manganese/zinc/iron transport system permease protein n=1 Tax=Arcanobacterium wilhelmae TaxID=1803177 RepID=A0ABT9N9F8_9ACTO|nr:metal ABC transporter permease [Arcanobacterium wilhelmae]MDP9800344.1 manganese/zinc/iron transport system permease protein [Arcanobacterium wilhelmae]WFN89780.1 metal ABC transporter permease [Arcanobacterium wilhelmae]